MKEIIFGICLSTLVLGCAKDSDPAPGATTPALKPFYQQDISFLNAALNKTMVQSESTTLGAPEIDLLLTALLKLEQIEPDGATFSEPHTYDTLYTTGDITPERPSLRVDRVVSWLICPMPMLLTGVSRDLTIGSLSVSLGATGRQNAYTFSPSGYFDYVANPPQFTGTPSATMASPAPVSVSHIPCQGGTSRDIITYSTYSAATWRSIQTFRNSLDSIYARVSALKNGTPSNYPVKYELQQVQADLNAAYALLP